MAKLIHPFIPEEDGTAKIWRYMDFPKFVSLLTSQSLYFSRSDLLGDPFEGSYPKQNKIEREKYLENFLGQLPNDHKSGISKEFFLMNMSQSNKFIASNMFVNCWHINQFESAAMWNIYVKNSKGISIQSQYKLLQELLPDDIFIGKVKYIDYGSQSLDESNFFNPIFHKRKSFDFENELRAITFAPKESLDENGHQTEPRTRGIQVKIDINKLITGINVSPSSENWFFNLVEDISNKFNLTIPIKKSPLDEEPFY